MDPRNPIIAGMAGMLVLLAISMSVAQPVNLPAGIENLSSTFRGFDAYLDNRISTISLSGTSMAPTVGSGDVPLYVDFPYDNLRAGDAILAIRSDLPDEPHVIHRIVEILPEGLRTKGDNRPEPDRVYIKREDFEGLVIGVLFTSSQGWHP